MAWLGLVPRVRFLRARPVLGRPVLASRLAPALASLTQGAAHKSRCRRGFRLLVRPHVPTADQRGLQYCRQGGRELPGDEGRQLDLGQPPLRQLESQANGGILVGIGGLAHPDFDLLRANRPHPIEQV